MYDSGDETGFADAVSKTGFCPVGPGDRTSARRATVVVCEDNQALAQAISRALTNEGFETASAKTEADLASAIRRDDQCILILGQMEGGAGSLATLKRLRLSGHRNVVIVLATMSVGCDCVSALRAGGDDYLTTPFPVDELVARVEALLRRSRLPRETRLVAGDLVMDLIERSVHRGSRAVALLPREYALLEFFMRRPHQVVTRSLLLAEVWGCKASLNTNVIDVHIGKLRHKLNHDGDVPLIRNKRGLGFHLIDDEQPRAD